LRHCRIDRAMNMVWLTDESQRLVTNIYIYIYIYICAHAALCLGT